MSICFQGRRPRRAASSRRFRASRVFFHPRATAPGKSSSVKLAFAHFFPPLRFASSSGDGLSAARSTRLTDVSPCRESADAMRFGMKTASKLFRAFRPTPMNIDGALPVTAFNAQTAAPPPRASPSSFVRIAPVMDSAESKMRGDVHRPFLVRSRASSTSKISCGFR